MTVLHNEVTIDAPVEKVWAFLSDIEELDSYDPAVRKSTALTPLKAGLGGRTRVKQVMQYRVKFGMPGRILHMLMIRRQSDAGIKKFMTGLKSYAETK